jgi:assimilatory nitrate reductase catalytic subunit
MYHASSRSPQATETHCPYCALQCGVVVAAGQVDGNKNFPVNAGSLCVKGWTATEPLAHPERLTSPLARNARGVLEPVDWDEALDRTARALHATQREYGRDAAGILGGGGLTNEKAYLLGKFARVALKTSNVDYNGRFCMSSAAAAANRAFGIDRGLPFPVEDIAGAETILLVGANPAETMPPLMRHFEAQRANGGRLIVADPRRTATARTATLHLRPIPGTDAALANGLLHILVREGLVDRDYIGERTEGFDRVAGIVATYWPERVERITGVPEADLFAAAMLLGVARTAMVLTARGAEQQSHGVENTLAYINLALALGLVGRPSSGFGAITGQGNGQGGREHGQKADQLPGYRRIDDPAARRHVAEVWDVPESELPGPGKSAFEMLASLGDEGGVRALLVHGFNPAVSAPDGLEVFDRLASLDFLCVTDFFLTETAKLADVVLPSAQWAEEEGTMTNLEGRVIRRRRAVGRPAGVRSDVEILCGLADRLGEGARFSYDRSESVFDELCRATRGGLADYSGLSYAKLEAAGGIFWPCPSAEHPGTPRLFADGFPTPNGRARFHAVSHAYADEQPDDDYPLFLTTGRVLAQYQSGSQTRRVARLVEMAPEPQAEIHPDTARRFGVANGNTIVLETRRGTATFSARVTPDIRQDTVFVPFHWGDEKSANRLTNPALDPFSRMPEFKVCAVRIASPRREHRSLPLTVEPLATARGTVAGTPVASPSAVPRAVASGSTVSGSERQEHRPVPLIEGGAHTAKER